MPTPPAAPMQVSKTLTFTVASTLNPRIDRWGMPEILQGLAAAARKELGFEGELHAGLRLVEDLQLDSIRLLSLAMAVEDHFQIALDADDEAGIVTVGDLLALIEKKLDETKPGGDGAS